MIGKTRIASFAAAAAMAGLVGGTTLMTTGCQHGNNTAGAATDSQNCKGKNDCKGKGGCSTSDNGCKGKNSCKGKGGCNGKGG